MAVHKVSTQALRKRKPVAWIRALAITLTAVGIAGTLLFSVLTSTSNKSNEAHLHPEKKVSAERRVDSV